jgi:hypothetical protein
VNELREDLDRALRTVTFGEAPVDRAKRAGRRIRARRRVALLAGALAVAAVAAGYPALSRAVSAAPPAPATGGHTRGGLDPVLTDGPPAGKTTRAPGGLASSTGEIAAGTMGGVRWTVTVNGPGPANPMPADPCFSGVLATVGEIWSGCADLPTYLASGLSAADPASFTGVSDTVTGMTVGVVAANVTYLVVTFTDGQQLKLIPVTAPHGHRYVAWVAPLTMTVAGVVAHLGGPYNDNGQTVTAVPFDPSGQMPVFGQWEQPGQQVPRATGVIGGGMTGSQALWSVTAYTGPWGVCMEVNAGGKNGDVYACLPYTAMSGLSVMNPLLTSVPGLRLILGSAPAGAAKVRITLSNGKAVTARTAAVGGDLLFAVAVTGNATATGWTADDAAGNQVGSGASVSLSNPAKTAKP